MSAILFSSTASAETAAAGLVAAADTGRFDDSGLVIEDMGLFTGAGDAAAAAAAILGCMTRTQSSSFRASWRFSVILALGFRPNSKGSSE